MVIILLKFSNCETEAEGWPRLQGWLAYSKTLSQHTCANRQTNPKIMKNKSERSHRNGQRT